MKSAGVIVTYNRKHLLFQNILMQINQSKLLDKLFIIDNHGTDGSYEYLVENNLWNESWMNYIKLPENTGGAGGFYYGLKIAYEEGFDYIWLMDDDGKPYNNNTWKELYSLANKLYVEKKELFINSLVTENGKELTFGFSLRMSLEKQWKLINEMAKKEVFFKGVANPFNGTLLTKETVQQVGFPNKDFFMTRDETDYLRRCEDANVLVGTALHSLYHHPKGKDREKRIGKIIIPIWENTDKEYYWIRNITFSYKYRHRGRLLILLLCQLIAILIWQDKKLFRIKQYFVAINNAKTGKMGKK